MVGLLHVKPIQPTWGKVPIRMREFKEGISGKASSHKGSYTIKPRSVNVLTIQISDDLTERWDRLERLTAPTPFVQ